jgi:OOP family OmpA-OmpF porin
MTKTTTNLLLMMITIVAGMYFYITCCSECNSTDTEPPAEPTITKELEATAYPSSINGNLFTHNNIDSLNFMFHHIPIPIS